MSLTTASCSSDPARTTAGSTFSRPRTLASSTPSVPSTTNTATTVPPSTTGPVTPTFSWKVVPIDDRLRVRMQPSWRAGCPVPLEQLRHITLDHWTFDGKVQVGELVVNADAVDDLEAGFAALFEQRFPIRQMRLIDDFGGNDDRSMDADNTSAFNCRPVAGSSHWSQHAFGRAVDINPIENPYLHGGVVSPPAGATFGDRSDVRPGMLVVGAPAVAAFTSLGWGWGGSWSSSKDYQHISRSGS